MPRLIKHGAIVQDEWLPVDANADTSEVHQILSLEQWQALSDKSSRAVQLEPGQEPDPLFEHLAQLPLVAINFPVLTDGRGFSYGRELRERGFKGELRACGHFIRDQMTYLHRCGFDAFQPADESDMEEALVRISDFSEHYQAAIDKPLPLFRRRV